MSEDTFKFCSGCGELRINLTNGKCGVCYKPAAPPTVAEKSLIDQLKDAQSPEEITKLLNSAAKQKSFD